ncbi:MAG: phage tail protein [Deltaproteobacteria bacterium]
MIVEAPVGTIIVYAGDVASPEVRLYLADQGWLVCDGSEVDVATFRQLAAVLGDIYGKPSAPTKLKLPDYRGQFLRGVDDRPSKQARDLDASTRDPADPATGTGNQGAKVGSTQDFAFQGHEHGVSVASGATTSDSGDAFSEVTDGQTTSIVSDSSYGDVKVASETRPTNVAVNFLVKGRTRPVDTWPGWVPGPN